MTTVYKEALGITTGDIVTPSYRAGPYVVVGIWGPRLWHRNWQQVIIWPQPVISLKLDYTDPSKQTRGHHAYINHIHREGEQWFANGGEIFVTKPTQPKKPAQINFDSFPEQPTPYSFQDDVDYYAGDGEVWHCEKCERDFNATSNDHVHPPCPHCNTALRGIPIIVMGNGQPSNEYIRGINV